MTLKTRLGLAIALLGISFLLAASGSFMLYPAPEQQTEIFKSYDHRKIVEPFTCGHSSNFAGDVSSGSGWNSVHYERTSEGRFVMKADDRVLLMATLSEEMFSMLLADGGQILEHSGDSATGFHFRYKHGHTLGTATIGPLQTIDVGLLELGPLSDGNIALSSKISVEEDWSRTNPE